MCECECVCVVFKLMGCVGVWETFRGGGGSFKCVFSGYVSSKVSFKEVRLRVSVERVCIEYGLCVIGDGGIGV